MILQFIEIEDFEYTYIKVKTDTYKLSAIINGNFGDTLEIKKGDYLLIKDKIVLVLKSNYEYNEIIDATEFIIYVKEETEYGHITKIKVKE